jgi:hypothetical protein
LPHLDPGAVLITSAPEDFADARGLGAIARSFERRADDRSYWLIDEHHGRLPVVFIGGAGVTTPLAVTIPFDTDFAARADAALRLWRVVIGRPHTHCPYRKPKTASGRLRIGPWLHR